MSLIVLSQVPKLGGSRFFAENGYVRVITEVPDPRTGQIPPQKFLSPLTFMRRAIAIWKGAKVLRKNGDRYRDEIRMREKAARMMVEVALEARRQMLVDRPIPAMIDEEFRKEYDKGFNVSVGTGMQKNLEPVSLAGVPEFEAGTLPTSDPAPASDGV